MPTLTYNLIPAEWRHQNMERYGRAIAWHRDRHQMDWEAAVAAARLDMLDLHEHETGPKPVHIPGRIGCSVAWCPREAKVKGMCNAHYHANWKRQHLLEQT